MSPSQALRIEDVSKRFGGVQALGGVTFEAPAGRITGLVGQNGAGKTTLINVVTQQIRPDKGAVYAGEKPITGLAPYQVMAAGLARTFQQLRLFENLSCLENVMLGLPRARGESVLACLFTPFAVRRERAADRERAMSILEEYGLAERAGDHATSLSYGLQKLLSLARLSASDASFALIDEPTSGLSAGATSKVVAAVGGLRDRGKTVLLVEHDMEVMFALADHIVVLDQGQVLCEGTPDQIRENPEVRAIYLGRSGGS